jgi:hypothetical protein
MILSGPSRRSSNPCNNASKEVTDGTKKHTELLVAPQEERVAPAIFTRIVERGAHREVMSGAEPVFSGRCRRPFPDER